MLSVELQSSDCPGILRSTTIDILKLTVVTFISPGVPVSTLTSKGTIIFTLASLELDVGSDSFFTGCFHSILEAFIICLLKGII